MDEPEVIQNDKSILQDVLDYHEPVVETVENPEEPPIETTETTEVKTEGEKVEVTEETPGETPETTEEPPETHEEPAEEPTEETPSELVELAKELDPESKLTDQAEIISLVKTTVKDLKETVESYEKANKAIYDAFNEMPEVSDFMKAVISGMDPVVAAGIHISETLAPDEGDKGSEEYKEARKKKLEQKAQNEKQLAEFQDNHKASIKLAEQFVTESKVDKAEFEGFLTDFDKEIAALKIGKINKSLLELVLKGRTFEKRVKEAEDRGYLRGKNEKIVQKKNIKENTDGLPELSGSSGKDKIKTEPDILDRVLSHRR